mgnify:FL=1
MFEWIKKHKVFLIFIIISSLVVVPLVIHILFKIDVENSFFSAEWTAGEFLGYYGSVLSFVGTVVLGALALYQNKLIKDESEKHEQTLISQEHERNMPKFSVKASGSYGNCLKLKIKICNNSENIASNIDIYDAKILSSEQKLLWQAEKPQHLQIIAPMKDVEVEFDNPSIDQYESLFIICMKCEDKYNDTHKYKIFGIYHGNDIFPEFEVEEIFN